jgi:hypothetical protein
MTRELQGWAKPRPLRVAFLVEDGVHADLALDGIFSDCYSRWGGRFSLIVPCAGGRVTPGYWPWLETYDPDIVYSYVPLSRNDVLEIHERLCPAQYFFHKMSGEPRLDVFGFKPDYRFAPLSSLSVIFRLARHSPTAGDKAPLNIIDSWHTETSSRFLTDNFGTYHASCATGIYPPDAASAASLLTIVSLERMADRQFGVPRDLNAIPNEAAAFEHFATKKTTSLAIASAMFASKLDTRSHRFSGSFNLVVGKSFTDRILFWNARLLIPAWLDGDLSCFRVDREQLDDPVFLSTLGKLLNQRNHVNGGAGGQVQLTVRSASLTSDQLKEVKALLLTTKPWSGVSTETVSSLDEVAPAADVLREARESNRFGGGLFALPNWTRFIWTPPIARPPAIVPDHLSDAPVRQVFTQGYWCTDYMFEYEGVAPRFAERNRWVLPRRWRVAGAFKTSLVSAPQHAVPPPQRRSRDGHLGVFLCNDHPVESIRVPGAYTALQYALAAEGRWAEPEAEHEQAHPLNRVAWTEPSNEARYLTGVLGMAGGLGHARKLLLHPFLQATFAKLGGSPDVASADVTPVINILRKRVGKKATFDLADEGERQYLAIMIAKASRMLKSPMRFVRYDELKVNWKTHREHFWATKKPEPNSDVDWDAREESSLDGCLIDLRRRQMMFQGHRWTCRKCHHKNWVDLGRLSPELSCEVCKERSNAPVNIQWLFRPNEFLIESLRDHSVLSLVWALSALCDRSRHSFLFAEPIWFGFSDQSDSANAEADLLVLSDGQALLCEVKSSWRGLRPSDIDDLVALATRLRPDTAVLAVMETGTGPVANLETAKKQLASVGINFEVLTPSVYAADDDPYLPSWNEE